MITQKREIESIYQNKKNPRLIKGEKWNQLLKSLTDFPEMMELRPIVIDSDGQILGGNMRYQAAKHLGWKEVTVVVAEGLTEEQKKEFLIKDNVNFGDWDWSILETDWTLDTVNDWGVDFFTTPEPINPFEMTELEKPTESGDGNTNTTKENDDNNEEVIDRKGNLSKNFIIPPFSVFDTKQGYWQSRKSAWKELGIKSEVGREGNLLGFSDTILNAGKDIKKKFYEVMANSPNANSVVTIPGYYDKKDLGMTDEEIIVEYLKSDPVYSGTSIFDPVLCEVSYRWFCTPGGKILDPFAGGSVRGVVASRLGYKYTGVDLREEQVVANREQGVELCTEDNQPNWIVGNSENISELISDNEQFDLIFTCPPYYDLEVYCDDPRDLSNKSKEDFDFSMESIVRQSSQMLKDDSFSVFVVGDVRRADGSYMDLIGATIKAHSECGFMLYNHAILLESLGTAGLRAPKHFNGGRKLTKVHQNVLVFYKGNPKNIKEKFGEVITEMDADGLINQSTEYGEVIKIAGTI